MLNPWEDVYTRELQEEAMNFRTCTHALFHDAIDEIAAIFADGADDPVELLDDLTLNLPHAKANYDD